MKHLRLLPIAILLFITTSAISQNNEVPWRDDADIVYTDIEQRPNFPGGIQAFYQFVAETYKIPREFKGSGKLIIQFVVEKDGSLTGFKTIKDTGKGTSEAAFAMLKKSPKWTPGIQNGKPVRVMFTMPLIIKEAPKRSFKAKKDIVD